MWGIYKGVCLLVRFDYRADHRGGWWQEHQSLSGTQPSVLRFALILGAMTAILPAAVDMYLPALPNLAESLSVDPSRVQLTLSAFFVGVAGGQLLHGPLSDRYGRKPLMLIGLALYVLASAGCAMATSVEALTVLRFVQALGACAGMVIALAVIRDAFPPQEGAKMISRMLLVGGLAPILAPFIGGQLLGVFGWRAIFWFLALYGAACFIAVMIFLPETRLAHTRGPTSIRSWLQGFSSVLAHRRFVGFALTRGFASAGMFTYIAGSPFVFIVLFGVPPQHYGWLFGLNALGLMAANQINIRLLRTRTSEQVAGIGVRVSITAGLLLVAAALLPVGLGWPAFAALLVPLFFCVATNGIINPNATSMGMAPFGDRAGTASALIGSITFMTAGIASAIVSSFPAHSALPMALTICAVEALAVFCFFVVALRAPAIPAARPAPAAQ